MEYEEVVQLEEKKGPLKSSLQVIYYVTEYWLHQDSNSWLVDLEMFQTKFIVRMGWWKFAVGQH